MTPIDRVLDKAPLTEDSPLALYRLTAGKYSTSLSGLGAAMYPGRWNAPGEEAIYTSAQIGVCVLERLVHTPKDRIPTDLALMTIQLSGDWAWTTSRAIDRTTQAELAVFDSLFQARLSFPGYKAHATPIAIVVPSVIVPVWNVVLYPGAREFWNHVSLASVEPFDYDPRLFPNPDPERPS